VDSRFQPPPTSLVRVAKLARRWRSHWTLYQRVFEALALVGAPARYRDRLANFEFALEGMQALRYEIYGEILGNRKPAPSQIMVTDLRDVLFQADPFSRPVDGLEVFLEEPVQRLGSDRHNRRWLHDLYETSGIERIANEVVSCSGTVIGDRDAVLRYLDAMAREITRVQGRWRRPLGSHDQAVHNWLLYTAQLGSPRIVANGSGRVLTMGAMTNLRHGDAGELLNGDGSVPAVLHQYDRHLKEAVSLVENLA
jgi:hypothetical protein